MAQGIYVCNVSLWSLRLNFLNSLNLKCLRPLTKKVLSMTRRTKKRKGNPRRNVEKEGGGTTMKTKSFQCNQRSGRVTSTPIRG